MTQTKQFTTYEMEKRISRLDATEALRKKQEAAEDMYEALKGLFSLHEPDGRFQPSYYKPFLKAAKEALAKAEGK